MSLGLEEKEIRVKRKKIRRRTSLRMKCLLSLDLWMWTLMRITCSTWRSFDIILSTLPSIGIRRLPDVPSMTHNLSLMMLTVSLATTHPVFGHLLLARVISLPRLSLDS
ncbi:hypothetical protein PIB30_050415 [Stylosanthes scabra]|uniref:Uncharacterized protein n=1 Tax=Stylosanthes scabra TaxID=79078 RepID=A0ABU6XFB4_9FABA|nr:hypothetical protein [Stylosanthes scabra]